MGNKKSKIVPQYKLSHQELSKSLEQKKKEESYCIEPTCVKPRYISYFPLYKGNEISPLTLEYCHKHMKKHRATIDDLRFKHQKKYKRRIDGRKISVSDFVDMRRDKSVFDVKERTKTVSKVVDEFLQKIIQIYSRTFALMFPYNFGGYNIEDIKVELVERGFYVEKLGERDKQYLRICWVKGIEDLD